MEKKGSDLSNSKTNDTKGSTIKESLVKPDFTKPVANTLFNSDAIFNGEAIENVNDYETTSVGSQESLENTAGPDFAKFANQLMYKESQYENSRTYFHPYTSSNLPNVDTLVKDTSKLKEVTTLFLVDSKNRDRLVFAQPTFFTLTPPRVYKNIVSIQVTQLKFLSAFLYFRADKGNIVLPIVEKGRETINTYQGLYQLTYAATIKEGTYGINDLIAELQIKLNVTPLFYDFQNGFTDFISLFIVNGDFSINFNQPGDTYYDSLNSKYIANPTINTIVTHYWPSRYAGLTDYTLQEIKMAYYYPVIHELLLDPNDSESYPYLNLDVPASLLSPSETVTEHILFNLTGLNDPVATYIIDQNITVLDTYRLNHTFRYFLVNKYQLAYDPNSLRINIFTNGLNTSLVNLFNVTSAKLLASSLDNLGLTTDQYTAINTIQGRSKVVFTDMYKYLQTKFATYFGVPYGLYSSQYFLNPSNLINTVNGLAVSGVPISYTVQYLLSGQNPISSFVLPKSSSPGYWPNFNPSNTSDGIHGGGIDASGINIPSYLLPYSVDARTFEYGRSVIDNKNYFIETNNLTRTADMLITVKPATYTVFKFRSEVRQTLKVETLPLPYYYRFSDYNAKGLFKGTIGPSNINVPQQFFDISYSYVYNSTNTLMDNSVYSTIQLQPIFGQTLPSTLNTDTTYYNINTQNNYFQFEFQSPYPLGISSILTTYATNLSLVCLTTSNVSTLFTDSFSAYLYHDRGAFMADLLNPRNENPLHYIASNSVKSNSSDLTLQFSTFSGNTYYTIFRSDNAQCFANNIAPIVYYNDSSYTSILTDYVNFNQYSDPLNTSNLKNLPFVVNYNKDFIRLPTQSTLQGISPTDSSLYRSTTLITYPIGYDRNGISSDLTDYFGYTTATTGFIPNASLRLDPFSKYAFQVKSPYDPVNHTYFGSNSSNLVLNPLTNNPYIFKSTINSEVKIVHWYDGFYIPQQAGDSIVTLQNISTSANPSLQQYLTGFPIASNGNIQFGRGINAIGFLPADGIYNIGSFSFKSATYPTNSAKISSNDPNASIKYIGIYSGSYLANRTIQLSDALSVLSFKDSFVFNSYTQANFPSFLGTYGTWYQYVYDSNFTSNSNLHIQGYSPNSNELLDYTSMYYLVPFNAAYSNITYSYLLGSFLPYPLSQVVSTGTTFNGNTAYNTNFLTKQSIYVIPSTISNADPAYGPNSGISQTQSQYEQSMPITTPSIAYRDYPYLQTNSNALYPFNVNFSRSSGIIPPANIGTTTFFTEYSDNLYLVNSLEYHAGISNVGLSIAGQTYRDSLLGIIGGGVSTCINYLVNPPSTLQNYILLGFSNVYSTIGFQSMQGIDSNVTTNSVQVDSSMESVTISIWGGGGAALTSANKTGGAGAYLKTQIKVETLLSAGISTLYVVVGKGGNRDNGSLTPTVGILNGYEEPRYGGGGTTILDSVIGNDSLYLQGGGFSGIFTDSNLRTATPLLIVGGGGAAGTIDYGGPGGIGILNTPLPVINNRISSAQMYAYQYATIPISTIVDVNSNPVLNGSTIKNSIDNNLLSIWDPTPTPYLNQNNYSPTPNTFCLSLNFNTLATTSISRVRYYGTIQGDTLHSPTGFIVYNDINKLQVLYSNTSISYSNFQFLNNGTYSQAIYDIPLSNINTNSTITNAWIVGGINTLAQNTIQYSIDTLNWAPVKTSSSLFTNIKAIIYNTLYKKWYACGQNGLLTSVNGQDWTKTLTDKRYTTIENGNSIMVIGASDGTIKTSTNGTSWSAATRLFPKSVIKIRYTNGLFWAIGSDFSGGFNIIQLKNSVDGINWVFVSNIGLSTTITDILIGDITYGSGKYVIAQTNTTTPYNSGIITYTNGLLNKASPLNISGFSGYSVVYAANIFVAGGKTTDTSSPIKYSSDGINWLNTRIPYTAIASVNELQYSGGKFIAVASTKPGTGMASNQASILTSIDGINWTYSITGGFSSDQSNAQALCSGYGQVNITPNLSTLYMEIQKSSNTSYELITNEIRVYSNGSLITTNTAPLIDNNLATVFYPAETLTTNTTQYPIVFTLSNLPSYNVNRIQIYSPNNANALFTGLTVQTTLSSQTTIYSKSNIDILEFKKDTNGNFLYDVLLPVPFLQTSSFVLNFTKTTLSSIQISEVYALNDQNFPYTYYTPSAIVSSFTNSLTKLNFTFNPPINAFNHMQVFTNTLSAINIYSDSNKTYTLYANSSPSLNQYLNSNLLEFDIIESQNVKTLYVELSGASPINSIKFINLGIDTDITTGYFGGNISTMQRAQTAINIYDGGGGSNTIGGQGGTKGYSGQYLIGGSPAYFAANPSSITFSTLTNSAGGGGGGLYGGGGGGITSNLGAAGGGGAGYISTSLFGFSAVIDYGLANPLTNYVAPGILELNNLVKSNALLPFNTPYGQGGTPSVDNGMGSHGLVSFTFTYKVYQTPPNNNTAIPQYVDGSRLSVLQAPLTYGSDNRTLEFQTYLDPIQQSQYSGYNWVWYRSYLSMTSGGTLLPSMKSSTSRPSYPVSSFSSLDANTYGMLVGTNNSIFNAVSTFFNSPISLVTGSNIVSSIQGAFTYFQQNTSTNSFLNTPYNSPSYIQMTEIYCLLDYLRSLNNLVYPHVNPVTSPIDRIFGGIPRFGYWANPFLTNVSYIGFDVCTSQFAPSDLAAITGNSNPVQAMYGLVLEQSLSTGVYLLKDVMAYKPSLQDASNYGSNWLKASQFPQAYVVRAINPSIDLTHNIPAQPYTIKNGINARLPLFNYSVYSVPITLGSMKFNSPIQLINDFEGASAYAYSFQNKNLDNVSTISISAIPLSSPTIQVNQRLMTLQAGLSTSVMGTVVSKYPVSSLVQSITRFGYSLINTESFFPILQFGPGNNNFYNTYDPNSGVNQSTIGRVLTDMYGNLFASDNLGSGIVYENICTTQVSYQAFSTIGTPYTTPGAIAKQYESGTTSPYYDFFQSKYTNIWHLSGTDNLSIIYGARLTSLYDYQVKMTFANQVFYPTHKIVLTKIATDANVMADSGELTKYPSYPHTQMFLYNNYSTFINDIGGKFALEQSNNFANTNINSGYFFDSYINNIYLSESQNFDNTDNDSFNYLAVRAYSPSESFQCLLRLQQASMYDFGLVSFNDLTKEYLNNALSNINIAPDYAQTLIKFQAQFSTTVLFGKTGYSGFSGSNYTFSTLRDFLVQYTALNTQINTYSGIINTINSNINIGISNLISGDLQYILPSYLASRQQFSDPIPFKVLFSTVQSSSNRGVEEYGLGYNLGFASVDTDFHTIQTATSFFKILDDYIYLRMNSELDMNRLDISQQENFAQTLDTTAQPQLYSCKLLLNNFGTYATTFIQSPATFTPPIGKLDKLRFSWYDTNGNLINNNDCEWSGVIQIVESVKILS